MRSLLVIDQYRPITTAVCFVFMACFPLSHSPFHLLRALPFVRLHPSHRFGRAFRPCIMRLCGYGYCCVMRLRRPAAPFQRGTLCSQQHAIFGRTTRGRRARGRYNT
jgi:hypothetical protein